LKVQLVHPGADYAVSDVFDGYKAALERAGVEVVVTNLSGRIVVASEALRAAWKRDKTKPKPSFADVLYQSSLGIVERALRFDVDWTLIVTGMYLHPDVLLLLARAGRKVGLILTESPYGDIVQAKLLPAVDLVFTNERVSIPVFKVLNPRTVYLPLAYDPARHHPEIVEDVDVPSHDVVFVGTGFIERVKILEGVDWSGIDFGLYGDWTLASKTSPLRQHIRGEIIPNETAAALYRRAKIGLNLYRTSIFLQKHPEHVTMAECLNPRALELAANGCFHLSTYRPEVAEVFGSIVPTFETPGQLETLIRSFIDDPAARRVRQTALPGCVADRTFDETARTILAMLDDPRRAEHKLLQEVG
jgi:hypothetical protein